MQICKLPNGVGNVQSRTEMRLTADRWYQSYLIFELNSLWQLPSFNQFIQCVYNFPLMISTSIVATVTPRICFVLRSVCHLKRRLWIYCPLYLKKLQQCRWVVGTVLCRLYRVLCGETSGFTSVSALRSTVWGPQNHRHVNRSPLPI